MSFGNTSFGANTSTAPTFNFGSTPATQSRGFGQTGFGFGSATTTASTVFGFGTSTTAPAATGFGTVAASTPFGATSTATPFGSTPASTGFGGFGSSSGFGTNTSSAAPTFSFNTSATTTTPSLFSGFGQTQTSTTGFSGFGTKPQTSFSGFGSATMTAAPFGQTGSLFGQPATSTGFGATTFGQNQPQKQQAPANPNEALLASVYRCQIFGDERDQIIGNWNLLQALWGTGKGYYAQNAPPFEYSPQILFCGLNTVGYSVKPKTNISDALVAISINKKPDEMKNQQVQFESSIASVLGNKPNITTHVDRVTPLPDSKSLVLIYIQEKQPPGVTRRVPNNDICSYLLQPMQKQQLINMGVDNVCPFVPPNDGQLVEYLENPPAGIDMRLWKKAQHENPDKNKFIPVPIIGFNGILQRSKYQEEQMKLHETLLDNVSDDISSMQRVQVATNVKLGELKQKALELEHRVLKLMVQVSRTGSENTLFGPEEERMKSRLESLEAAFNKPLGISDQLYQIQTTWRMHDVSNEKRFECDVDDNIINDLKEFLTAEQRAIRELKNVLQSDLADMKIMQDEMNKFRLD